MERNEAQGPVLNLDGVARKAYDAYWHPAPCGSIPWDEANDNVKDSWRRTVLAVIATYDPARFKVAMDQVAVIWNAIKEPLRGVYRLLDMSHEFKAPEVVQEFPESPATGTTQLPQRMTQGELYLVLGDIQARINRGDSFEGWIEWGLPDDPTEQPEFDVRAGYRIGNSEGQGGFRVIGRYPDTAS